MKKKQILFLFMANFVWFSCTKNEIKPNTTAAETPSFHFNTAPLSATTYTTSAALSYTSQSNFTISGKSIASGTVPSISLYNCSNVTITQNSLGNATNVGIYLYQCTNITIEYNYITNVTGGVYVDHSTGGGIIVNYNQFLNIQGPAPRGQFVQFNTVSGANNSISYNVGQNVLGKSNPQEAINVYMSNGTAASPITVNGNWIMGGGPASAGGGIQLGDTGGSYETATNNILVNPGQMGISISGGSHMTVSNNEIYAKDQSFTNVGIIVWGQAGYSVTSSTVSSNLVNFTSSSNAQNPYYFPSGQATPTGWTTNTWNSTITASILPATILTATAASVPLPIANPTQSGGTQSSPTYTVSSPVNLTGQSGVTITGESITGGTVPAITLTNCNNITITKNLLENSTNVGIYLVNCYNIDIENNDIKNVSGGVYAITSTNGNIVVNNNLFLNIQGPSPRGQFVQFNGINGANNSISNNKCQNNTGASAPQDAINLFESNGTAASPITVNGNWILGGGPSTTGGGIMLGDNGGSYQTANANILVNPGEYGIGISGGSSMVVTNNSIFAAKQSFTNVGIYVYAQAGYAITKATVSGNLVNWTNSSGAQNSDWLASGQASPTGWSTNVWGDTAITASVLASSIVSF